MKEGTKVKVVACHTGHEFMIGEIVERRAAEYDEEQDSLGFYSEDSGLWYMQPDEYETVNEVGTHEQLNKDALRYQWLRSKHKANKGSKTATVVFWLDEPYEPEDADELDRMIDNFLDLKK